jgi:hypothetical protein
MHVRPSQSHIRAEDRLSDVRKKALSMREQGWRWEMQGRAFAYREAARQVKRWLLDHGPADRGRIEFVIELLENSADVYDTVDETEIVRD